MRPLSAVTLIILGSCFAITFSLTAVIIVVLVLGDEYPRLQREFDPLLESAIDLLRYDPDLGRKFLHARKKSRVALLGAGWMWLGLLGMASISGRETACAAALSAKGGCRARVGGAYAPGVPCGARRASLRGWLPSPLWLLAVTVVAEVLVGLDLVLQFPHDEFDHDGVIEKSEARNMVGNQVFRLGEIGERIEYARGVLVRQSPLEI